MSDRTFLTNHCKLEPLPGEAQKESKLDNANGSNLESFAYSAQHLEAVERINKWSDDLKAKAAAMSHTGGAYRYIIGHGYETPEYTALREKQEYEAKHGTPEARAAELDEADQIQDAKDKEEDRRIAAELAEFTRQQYLDDKKIAADSLKESQRIQKEQDAYQKEQDAYQKEQDAYRKEQDRLDVEFKIKQSDYEKEQNRLNREQYANELKAAREKEERERIDANRERVKAEKQEKKDAYLRARESIQSRFTYFDEDECEQTLNLLNGEDHEDFGWGKKLKKAAKTVAKKSTKAVKKAAKVVTREVKEAASDIARETIENPIKAIVAAEKRFEKWNKVESPEAKKKAAEAAQDIKDAKEAADKTLIKVTPAKDTFESLLKEMEATKASKGMTAEEEKTWNDKLKKADETKFNKRSADARAEQSAAQEKKDKEYNDKVEKERQDARDLRDKELKEKGLKLAPNMVVDSDGNWYNRGSSTVPISEKPKQKDSASSSSSTSEATKSTETKTKDAPATEPTQEEKWQSDLDELEAYARNQRKEQIERETKEKETERTHETTESAADRAAQKELLAFTKEQDRIQKEADRAADKEARTAEWAAILAENEAKRAEAKLVRESDIAQNEVDRGIAKEDREYQRTRKKYEARSYGIPSYSEEEKDKLKLESQSQSESTSKKGD